jgi:hypothetical protein
MKSFEEIWKEKLAERGMLPPDAQPAVAQPAQPAPLTTQDLAAELGRIAKANSELDEEDQDDDQSDTDNEPSELEEDTDIDKPFEDEENQHFVCENCGHRQEMPADWRTSDATKETGNAEPDGGVGNNNGVPDWSDSFKSHMRAMVHRKIWGAVPPAETNN